MQAALSRLRPQPFTTCRHPCLHGTKYSPGGKRRRWQSSVVAEASDKAATLLVEGKRVYESGDRLAALRFYEGALKEGPVLSLEQKLAAMFGTVAVHASFGDVELAQMVLRDAILAGLDYEAALDDPANPTIRTSPQILIQLGRFNKQLLKSRDVKSEDASASTAKAKTLQRQAGGSTTRVTSDEDLSKLLGAVGKAQRAVPDIEGIDASPAAIAQRVSLVVVAGVALGVVLFFAGLEYTFPQM